MEPKTKIRRFSDRSVPEKYPEILQKGLIAHVGFCEGDQPYVIPLLYHYELDNPKQIYLHGAPGSRIMQHVAKGNSVCIEVTMVNGLIYSRTAPDHSMNYQSVICFGRAKKIVDEDRKSVVFENMVSRYFKGRQAGRDYEAPTPADFKSTVLLEVTIENWSAKERDGGPNGPRDTDSSALGTAGVIEIQSTPSV